MFYKVTDILPKTMADQQKILENFHTWLLLGNKSGKTQIKMY